MWDSRRLGAGWGAEGPQSGYFPFWIGAVLLLASLCNLALALRAQGGAAKAGGLFVTWPQLRLVLSVLLPTALLRRRHPLRRPLCRLGRAGGVVHDAPRRLPVADAPRAAGLATALVAFVVFESGSWSPSRKGPIETWLGY